MEWGRGFVKDLWQASQKVLLINKNLAKSATKRAVISENTKKL